MEKILRRLASFATFDLPLNVGYNQLQLRTIHNEQTAVTPRWTIEGTRRKLIAHYWYSHVLTNYQQAQQNRFENCLTGSQTRQSDKNDRFVLFFIFSISFA